MAIVGIKKLTFVIVYYYKLYYTVVNSNYERIVVVITDQLLICTNFVLTHQYNK